jgi:hypothetical protein
VRGRRRAKEKQKGGKRRRAEGGEGVRALAVLLLLILLSLSCARTQTQKHILSTKTNQRQAPASSLQLNSKASTIPTLSSHAEEKRSGGGQQRRRGVRVPGGQGATKQVRRIIEAYAQGSEQRREAAFNFPCKSVERDSDTPLKAAHHRHNCPLVGALLEAGADASALYPSGSCHALGAGHPLRPRRHRARAAAQRAV